MKYLVSILLICFFISCKKEKKELTPISVYEIGTQCRINDLDMISPGRWIACSGARSEKGYISSSDDHGASWTSYQLDQPSSAYSVDFLDSLNGFAGGDFLHLWRTFDGGNSWGYYWLGNQVPMNEEDRPAVRDFIMWNDSTWYFCGGENLGEGVVYETTDGGQHWYYQFKQHEYRALHKDEGSLMAAGHGSILISHQGLNDLQSASFENDFITDLVKNANGDWIASSYQGAFYRSQDGQNWSLVMKGNRPFGGHVNWSCMAIHENRILAAGADGALAESWDGGLNWTLYTVANEPDLWSLMIAGDEVYAGGEEGKIFRLF